MEQIQTPITAQSLFAEYADIVKLDKFPAEKYSIAEPAFYNGMFTLLLAIQKIKEIPDPAERERARAILHDSILSWTRKGIPEELMAGDLTCPKCGEVVDKSAAIFEPATRTFTIQHICTTNTQSPVSALGVVQ